MKRLISIIVLIFIVVAILIYSSVSNIQIIFTNKRIYSPGEEIKVHWFDFSLKTCSCSENSVIILKKNITGWEKVDHQLYNSQCVNGSTEGFPIDLECDIVVCKFPKPYFLSGTTSWNSKIYVNQGEIGSCINSKDNSIIYRRFRNYELKNAPLGKYILMFGKARKTIEIK